MHVPSSFSLAALGATLVSGASLNYARIPMGNNGPALAARQTCSSNVDELVGFGQGTTGGGSGEGTTVTSCSALESAVAAGGVIKISGMLTGCGIIDLQGDTTVIGVGADSGM